MHENIMKYAHMHMYIQVKWKKCAFIYVNMHCYLAKYALVEALCVLFNARKVEEICNMFWQNMH